MSVRPGQIIDGKYRVLRLIGRGGVGSVFEGEHIFIERRVAIKVLNTPEPDVVARFVREARAAGRIGNDHILEILDVGALPDAAPYMVAELLEGETLQQRLRRHGPFAPRDAVPVMVELLDGIGAAHRAGVVHRDLKPDNVFLVRHKAGRHDFVKIIDFGISKFQSGGPPLSLTRTGQVVGTPYYLAPEQARDARSADARSDLYAVGAILYQLVTGKIPFEAATLNELLVKISSQAPAPPTARVPGLDPNFSALIMRAMERDPAARFQTAAEFERALSSWAGPHASTTSMLPSVAPTQPPPTSFGRGTLPVAPTNFGLDSVPPPQLPPPSFGQSSLPAPTMLARGASPPPADSIPPHRLSSNPEIGPTLLSAQQATASAFGGTRSEPVPGAHSVGRLLLAAIVSMSLLVMGFVGVAAWLGRGKRVAAEEVGSASGAVSVVTPLGSASEPFAAEPAMQVPFAASGPRVEPATTPGIVAPTFRATGLPPQMRTAQAPSASSPSVPVPSALVPARPAPSAPPPGSSPEFGY